MKKHKYFISGASGFIGGSLFDYLSDLNASVVGMGRSYKDKKNYFQCDIFNNSKLKDILQDVTCIVHCAGYAHAFEDSPYSEMHHNWRINYEGTKNLVNLAVQAGAKIFINLSSVKAMGGVGDLCVDESWEHPPESDYGKSKLAAEKFASQVGLQFGIRVINLRLCMVYGAGGQGNLERMVRYVRKGIFPPLPETNNHRSMVHISDVIQAIMCVSESDHLKSNSYIVTGPDAPSGRQIYDKIRKAFGMPSFHIEVPRIFLELLAYGCEIVQYIVRNRLPFNRNVLHRLLNSEWYSSNKLESMVDWRPRVTLDVGLLEMARDQKTNPS